MTQGRRSRTGEVLAGKYRLDALLGAGGMGEVYQAENLALGRNVAIKLIREEHGESAEIVMRFLREARTANAVRHPNVVDVLDVGQAEDGTPFIVQELLEGEDLARYTKGRGGKLAMREAIDTLLPAIDAVAFAHARGVIHRDLKPENIFLARDHAGALVPKLLDFGISRHLSTEDVRMTATGMTVGTPAYMSPEQIRAERVVDARSDVWSLGVILYETLSGVLPYQSSAPSALFVRIVTEPPIPLLTSLPSASPELAAVVERCLRAKAEDRYASAADLARDLRVLVGQASPEPDGSDAATMVRGAVPSVPPPTMAGMPSPSLAVPDLELPSSRAKVKPAPPPPSSSSSPVIDLAIPSPKSSVSASRGMHQPLIQSQDDYGNISTELTPLTGRISLAEDPRAARAAPLPPARVARASLGMRGTVTEHQPDTSLRSLVGIGVMWMVVLGITAGLTSLVPGEWPIVFWATQLDGAPIGVNAAVVGLLAALGIGALIAGARARPASWGLLVAAPGLLIDAVILAGFIFPSLPKLTGNGGLDGLARVILPWPTTLVPIGVCMLFLRQAWWSWTSPSASGKTPNTLIKIVIAALALFGAVQIVRGAEAAPPTNIAS